MRHVRGQRRIGSEEVGSGQKEKKVYEEWQQRRNSDSYDKCQSLRAVMKRRVKFAKRLVAC